MLKRKIISFCTLALMLSASVCNPLCIYAETNENTSYTDEQGNTVYVTEDGFEYTIENGEITITKYTGDAVDLTIPDYIEGLPVTTLSINRKIWAMFDTDIVNNIETVTCPETLKTIQAHVFQNMPNLKNIYLNDGLETIKNYSISSCNSLEKLVIPSTVKNIDRNFILKCEDLTEITALTPYFDIPEYLSEEQVTYNIYENSLAYTNCSYYNHNILGTYVYDDFAFNYEINEDDTATINGCNFEYVAELNIPEYIDGHKVTGISDYAFQKYAYLKKVYMPDTIENLGVKSFFYCDNLEFVKLSNNIKDLQTNITTFYPHDESNPMYQYSGIFELCSSLKQIVIPEGIETIECNTFRAVDFEKIVLPKSLKSIQSDEDSQNQGIIFNDNIVVYTYPDAEYSLNIAKCCTQPYKILGDVSGNNEIDSSDALTLLNTVVGNSEKTDDMEVCDFDYDGEITSADVLTLLNYIVGNTDSLY